MEVRVYTNTNTIEVEEEGRRVRVKLTSKRTDGTGRPSVWLELEPVDCDLDGEEPGVYYLVPRGEGRLSPS